MPLESIGYKCVSFSIGRIILLIRTEAYDAEAVRGRVYIADSAVILFPKDSGGSRNDRTNSVKVPGPEKHPETIGIIMPHRNHFGASLSRRKFPDRDISDHPNG